MQRKVMVVHKSRVLGVTTAVPQVNHTNPREYNATQDRIGTTGTISGSPWK